MVLSALPMMFKVQHCDLSCTSFIQHILFVRILQVDVQLTNDRNRFSALVSYVDTIRVAYSLPDVAQTLPVLPREDRDISAWHKGRTDDLAISKQRRKKGATVWVFISECTIKCLLVFVASQ